MTKAPRGMFVPVVTPFKEDQSIDFDAFKKVIDFVIDGGMDGILICGSTGEYHAMRLDEQMEVIKKGCEYVAGRIPVMAGVGRSTPSETIKLANFAADCGAEWGLVLPPYYQTTTEQGVKDFFTEIADNSKIAIVIYNNPLSTTVELAPELVYELAQHENIVSIKDTSDMEHTCKVIAATKDVENFTVFQGYEHLILPSMLVGAQGGFAILMNMLPKEYAQLNNLIKEGKWEEAAKLNISLANLYSMMEDEPYPGPVKAGMELLGIPGGCVRKPLVQPSDALKKNMKAELEKIGYKFN